MARSRRSGKSQRRGSTGSGARGGRSGRAATYGKSPAQIAGRGSSIREGSSRTSANPTGGARFGGFRGATGRGVGGNTGFDIEAWLNSFGGGGYGGYGGGTGTDSGGGLGDFDPDEYRGKSDELREKTLAAALESIGAEFDLKTGQLGAERDTFRNMFSSEKTAISQGRDLAQDAVYDDAVNRGMLRSGVTKKNLVRADQPFAARQASNIGKYNPQQGQMGSEFRRIDSAVKLMGQQEDAQMKEARIQSEREQLEMDKQLALLIAGMGG